MNGTQNVLTDFKKMLGYTDVTNQYVELCQRAFSATDSKLFTNKEDLLKYAHSFGLNLSAFPVKACLCISGSYIISVHSSFMLFLNNYKSLAGAPTQSAQSKTESETLLDWVLNAVYKANRSDDVKALYDVCNYYRLVRNQLVHGTSNSTRNEYRIALSRFKNMRTFEGLIGKLSAPNDIEHISFDDQVLFSKSAHILAKRIYFDAEYDLKAHVDANLDCMKMMISGYSNNPKRLKQMVYNYLLRFYPINQEKYDEVISEIVAELLSV